MNSAWSARSCAPPLLLFIGSLLTLVRALQIEQLIAQPLRAFALLLDEDAMPAASEAAPLVPTAIRSNRMPRHLATSGVNQAARYIPPLAARILADDTEEQLEQDAAAFAAWCAARGVECVRVLGVSEFAPVA